MIENFQQKIEKLIDRRKRHSLFPSSAMIAAEGKYCYNVSTKLSSSSWWWWLLLSSKKMKHFRGSSNKNAITGEMWCEFCKKRLLFSSTKNSSSSPFADDEFERRKIMYRKIRREKNFSEDPILTEKLPKEKLTVVEDFSDHTTLRKNGQETLERFLSVFKETVYYHEEAVCSDVLTSISSLLLHLMHEEDAFACLSTILSSDRHFTLFRKCKVNVDHGRNNTIKNSPSSISLKQHFEVHNASNNTSSASPSFLPCNCCVNWRKWVICELPYSHLIYIFDCFLLEGTSFVAKLAATLLTIWYNNKGTNWYPVSCETKLDQEMSDFCRNITISPQNLLKLTFAKKRRVYNNKPLLPNKEKSVGSLVTQESSVKEDVHDSPHAIVRLSFRSSNFSYSGSEDSFSQNFLRSSNILCRDQMQHVYNKIPVRHHLQEVKKLFSSDENGISFVQLWSQIETYAPTILIIRTIKNDIFGAFCTEDWSKRHHFQKMKYFGTGESFLFKIVNQSAVQTSTNGEVFFYPWVGKELLVGANGSSTKLKPCQELFQAANDNCLLIGGGAICLRNSLSTGSSDAAATFLNPPLAIDTDFDVQLLELFGFC